MIKKEFYKEREDGVRLFRTFSDTDHKIRNKRTSEVYTDATDIAEDEEYEEVEEYIEMEGASTYEEVLAVKESVETDRANTIRKINHLHLTNEEALSVKELYPRWEDKVGKTIEVGFITLYKDNLWRARQTHTPLEVYPPSLATASLYEVIDKEHSGEADDPIPYAPPMEIYEGKHYVEDGVVYRCTRNSGVALTHRLADLVGLYVDKVK
jgi:hypothetical protein